MTQFLLLAALPCSATGGNNRGNWQGTLTPPNQNGGIRLAVQDRQERQRCDGSFEAVGEKL